MKRMLIAALMAALSLTAAAAAQAASTYKASSKATQNAAGTTAKPAPFKASFTYGAAGENGARPLPANSWTWKWDGVQVNGGSFPSCTAEQIDEAQSDSVCPKGSLVGGGPLVAQLGPTSDPTSATKCEGKTIKMYNGGATKLVWLVTGPGDKCAGVGYIPPLTMKLATKRGTTTTSIVYPENFTHPLPGVDAGLSDISLTFNGLKRKVGGKTIYYMSSTSCSGNRKFSFIVKDADGTHALSANAGKCTK